jgi:hypothetical protein
MNQKLSLIKIIKNNHSLVLLFVSSVLSLILSIIIYFWGKVYSMENGLIGLDENKKILYSSILFLITFLGSFIIFIRFILIKNYFLYGIETTGNILNIYNVCYMGLLSLFYNENEKFNMKPVYGRRCLNMKDILIYFFTKIIIEYKYTIDGVEYNNSKGIYLFLNNKEYKIGEDIVIIVKYNKKKKSIIRDFYVVNNSN